MDPNTYYHWRLRVEGWQRTTQFWLELWDELSAQVGCFNGATPSDCLNEMAMAGWSAEEVEAAKASLIRKGLVFYN